MQRSKTENHNRQVRIANRMARAGFSSAEICEDQKLSLFVLEQMLPSILMTKALAATCDIANED